MGAPGDIQQDGRATSRAAASELRLLGGFQLRVDDRVVESMHSCERVLAFLALNDRSLPRMYVAASLWPDTTDRRACANLRSALWRLHRLEPNIVDPAGSHLRLRSNVWVDVRFVDDAARRYRASGAAPRWDFVDRVRGELLPGFWDSWLVFERERLRQEMINLYQVMCHEALARHDAHLAVLAALAAVECDPLREDSNCLLVHAYLAAGNEARARAMVNQYTTLLADDPGARPSATFLTTT